MATYKVIQDIEAEDKLLGPLTLKQFIYAIIVVVAGFIAFKLGTVKWYLALPFLPPMAFFGILAAPLGRDQPTEVWVLAKIRYFFKPRLRKWDQTGIQELVTITAPKKIEEHFSDNLSQTEVKSRLKALADTIDSRGWVLKNANVSMFDQPGAAITSSDRLVELPAPTQEVPAVDIHASDDIMDPQNNLAAQKLNTMISTATQNHRQEMLDKMQAIRESQAAKATNQPATAGPSQDLWFMNQPAGQVPPGYATFGAQSTPVATTGSTKAEPLSAAEQAVLDQAHAPSPAANNSHMRVIQPLSAGQTSTEPSTSVVTPDPGIIGLAHNNDLNVDSLSREANQNQAEDPSEGEVVISLH